MSAVAHYLPNLIAAVAAGLVAYGAIRVKVDRLERDVHDLAAGRVRREDLEHVKELAMTGSKHLGDSLQMIREEMTTARQDLHRELELLREELTMARTGRSKR